MLRPGGDTVPGDCGGGSTGATPRCCLLYQAPADRQRAALGSREAAAGAARPLQGLALTASLPCTPAAWPGPVSSGLRLQTLGTRLPARRTPWGATVGQQEGEPKAAWPAPSPGGAGTGRAGCPLLGGGAEPRLWAQCWPGARAQGPSVWGLGGGHELVTSGPQSSKLVLCPSPCVGGHPGAPTALAGHWAIASWL